MVFCAWHRKKIALDATSLHFVLDKFDILCYVISGLCRLGTCARLVRAGRFAVDSPAREAHCRKSTFSEDVVEKKGSYVFSTVSRPKNNQVEINKLKAFEGDAKKKIQK